MRDKAILLILSVLSIIFISLFFIISPSFITEDANVKHFEDKDISFNMSKSWTVYEYDDPMKTPFLSTSPNTLLLNPVDNSEFSYYDGNLDDLSSDGEVINTSSTNAFDVAIVKTEISKIYKLPDGITLNDAYKSDSLYSLMNSSGQFELVNNTSMTVSGKPTYQFIYKVSGNIYYDTWVEADGYYLRILSQAPNKFIDKVSSQFDYLISTLEIK